MTRRRARLVIGVTLVGVIGLTGCSSSPEAAVTLTVRSTVAASTIPAVTVATTSGSTSAASPVTVAPSSSVLSSSAASSSDAVSSAVAVTPTEPPTTTIKAPTASGTRTPATTKKSTAAGPAQQASANVNTPGPDNGPACAADKQYSDEAPTGLRADVKAAWISVKKVAKAKGITLCLNDGKRSKAQQIQIYDDYVKQYGVDAANFYVLPPDKSAHVKGYAVDVQPATAYQWLQAGKGRYGWCRIYDNEAWHFEYSTQYQKSGCPARLPMPER